MDDGQLVAKEITFLRARGDEASTLRAQLLEEATTATAAAFLRSEALRALSRFGDAESWMVSTLLQAEIIRERRAAMPHGWTGRIDGI